MKKLQFNSDNSFRSEFFLTQKELAQYLGVSRSLLNLSERGERSLPKIATQRLSELSLAWVSAVEDNSSFKPDSYLKKKIMENRALYKKKYSSKLHLCQYKLDKQRQTLEQMKAKNENTALFLTILMKLIPGKTSTEESKRKKSMLEYYKQEATRKFLETDEGPQSELRESIVILEAQIAYLKNPGVSREV